MIFTKLKFDHVHLTYLDTDTQQHKAQAYSGTEQNVKTSRMAHGFMNPHRETQKQKFSWFLDLDIPYIASKHHLIKIYINAEIRRGVQALAVLLVTWLNLYFGQISSASLVINYTWMYYFGAPTGL